MTHTLVFIFALSLVTFVQYGDYHVPHPFQSQIQRHLSIVVSRTSFNLIEDNLKIKFPELITFKFDNVHILCYHIVYAQFLRYE